MTQFNWATAARVESASLNITYMKLIYYVL